MNIMVLIPAYNEEKNIADVIHETKQYLPEAHIVVVNDGSTDNTQHILEQTKNITVLNHPFNVGIGGAITTGFHYFLRNNFDYLVRIDGDGQHVPSQAPDVLEPIIEKKADSVIGSRFLEKKGYQSSFTRKGGIKLLYALSTFILKKKITDNTSGFKAYNRNAVEQVVEDYPSDYPEPIEVYLIMKKGLQILEVPVTMKERQSGTTSISLLDTYYYLIKVLLTIFIHFLVGGKK
jgi:glycosyltransferase involved in cell wall biosynthesis